MNKTKKDIILFLLLLSTICYCQNSTIKNQNLKNKLGLTSGIYANYGSSNFEIDGFARLNSKDGFFIESLAITDFFSSLVVNNSIGLMKPISSSVLSGAGYSNYYEKDSEVIHELFIGISIASITNFIFFDVFNAYKPNALGIIDMNQLVPNLYFDFSLIGVVSQELDEVGGDLFLNFSKLTKNGFAYGYIFSRERFEDENTVKRKFKKNGIEYEKFIQVPLVNYDIFHNFYIGLNLF
tara:strand:- start:47 stop:760 length:714 start_codon:yes stop_codon:yes gene_type:complete